ncbi:MAG: hypothetical protein J5626_09495 [Lachnospiraceae bacterium]|nr:hypothetical protein [Lachnospiraceae bacterium]
MIRPKKMCVAGFLIYIIAVLVACGEKPTTEVEIVNEVKESGNGMARNDASAGEAYEIGGTVPICTSLEGESSGMEGRSIEERLLIIPDEDIPESIKAVFTEYAEFNLVFDLGSDVNLVENGETVELSVEYHTLEESIYDVHHLMTDIKSYDCAEPWYSENSKCALYWRAYRVMDFDNDGINELVYIVSPDDDIPSSDDYYIIFHEIGGKVYAYASYLYCNLFTEDGVMTIGHGSIDYLYKITSFDTERYYIECLSYINSIRNDIICVVGNKYVSYDEFYKFEKENYMDKNKALFKSKDGLVTLW